jgi:CheY-like chemotaxis protein
MKRILIADDNATVRRGLRGVIQHHQDWGVCGETVDGREAIERARELLRMESRHYPGKRRSTAGRLTKATDSGSRHSKSSASPGAGSVEAQFQQRITASSYTILPWQFGCGQRHSRSGVFSIASHSTLQYLLPSVVIQVQGGCAHFLLCAAINPPSSSSRQREQCVREEINPSQIAEWCSSLVSVRPRKNYLLRVRPEPTGGSSCQSQIRVVVH